MQHPVTILVAFAFPCNIILINILREKGVFTFHGMVRWAFLAAQCVTAGFLAATWPEIISDAARTASFDAIIPDFLILPGIIVTVYVLGIIFICIKYFYSPTIPQAVSFWSLVLSFWVFNANPPNYAFSKIFVLTALIIGFSIFETSYRLAYYDELTQLPGRRALNELLPALGHRYAMGMIDIDHFKKFNDTHGHDAGDQVLKMVAAQLKTVGGGGKPFRYGGEEFTVIFPGKEKDFARHHLENLRARIAGSRFVIRSTFRFRSKPTKKRSGSRGRKKVTVTVSIGVAERNDVYNHAEDVLKAADKALYRAKKGGRNQVAVSR